MKAIFFGLLATGIILSIAGATKPATKPANNQIVLTSPDGLSTVTIAATNQGSFVVLNGPEGRTVNLFSAGGKGLDQSGLAVYRQGVGGQAA